MAKQSRIIVGQVAAITGGARGIGKETARALVREGMKVAIGDLDLEAAKQAAEEIGGGTIALELNVTDRDVVRRVHRRRRGAARPARHPRQQRRDHAARARSSTRTTRTTQREIDINVYGVLYGIEGSRSPRFVTRGRGHLVNIASMAGKAGYRRRRHLLRHQALRRRRQRGAARRAARHRHRGLVRHARRRQHRARRRPARRRAASRTSSPRTSPTRSSRRSRSPRFDVYVPRSVGPLSQFSSLLPRRGREGMARALKADKVLSQRRPERAPGLRAARLALGAGPRAGRRAEGARGELDELTSALARALARGGPPSQAAIRRRSPRPASSWRKCEAFSMTSGSGAPIASAKRCPVSSGRIGSRSAHSTSSGSVVGAQRLEHALARPRRPASRASVGSISGKARAPALRLRRRERRLVGARGPRRRDRARRRRGRASRSAGPRCARRSRGTRSRRRSCAGGR